jgi:hypothetical protein
MGFVQRGVSHRFERLTLMNIGRVLMAYIVTLCWFFKVIVLCHCIYV